jgi:hypothetical protein
VYRLILRVSLLALLTLAVALPVRAQDDDDDMALRPAEPEFTVISLPTTMRVPRGKGAFRVTHRFLRELRGDFGDVAGDLFGLDGGATTGLEYRYGLIPGGQIGVHRSGDNKTVQFFTEYSLLRQSRAGLDVAAIATIEGTDNFDESYSPALGAVISRKAGDWAAFYVEPIWVNNSNPLPGALVDDNDTVMVGLGTRLRIRPTVYVSAEWTPRVSGYGPGTDHGAFAFEKRAGGHMFQLTFSTTTATTMGQLARGSTGDSKDWRLGFAIMRKFY